MEISAETFRQAGSDDPDQLYGAGAERYAEHLGVGLSQARQMLLGEVEVLHRIHLQNDRDLTESGLVAHAVSEVIARRKTMPADNLRHALQLAERPWLVRDNYCRVQDPGLVALDTIQFTMQDEIGRPPRLIVGRPDGGGMLHLWNGSTEGHYQAVADGVRRIREAQDAGYLPNLNWDLTGIFVPYAFAGQPLARAPLEYDHASVQH
jgi:hypothetical protein